MGYVSRAGRGRGGGSVRGEGELNDFLKTNGALIFDMWGCSRRVQRILRCG